jgi:3-oxoacyl-[acyl-carrier-protein] synthase II
MTRVVITGIGAVTPLANNFPSSWNAIKAGVSGLRTLSRFSMPRLKWPAAGELQGFKSETYLSPKEVRRLDAFAWYAVAAAVMAAEDAGLISTAALPCRDHYVTSGGVIVGSSRGGISMIEQALEKMQNSGPDRSMLSPYLMPATTISMAASSIARKIGITGCSLSVSNACASGSNAIGEAYRMLKAGFRGPVLAGGTDAPICRLCVEGYGRAGALSKADPGYASRPFDTDRDGFVLSEGACMLVLENLDNALERGAEIYGEIAGYGNTVDARHETRPDVRGELQAMGSALDEAGISPCDLDFINAHGTSTQVGDLVEAEAISSLLGKKTASVPVSAIKSITGHMLAASGAFEAGCTVMSLKEGIIPPTINTIKKDIRCEIDLVTEKRNFSGSTALSSSFGFGGVNAVLAFRKFNS